MAEKKHSFIWLIIGIFSLFALGYSSYTLSPTTVFPYPIPQVVKPVYLFFLLFFFFLFSFATYFLRRKRRGILFALFVCAYLILRLNNFTDPLITILLLAFFLSVEIGISKLYL